MSSCKSRELPGLICSFREEEPLGFFLFVCLFNFIYLFYFWLRWVFVAARGLSLVAVSEGYSLLRCTGFSLQWLFLLRSTGSRHTGSVVVDRSL